MKKERQLRIGKPIQGTWCPGDSKNRIRVGGLQLERWQVDAINKLVVANGTSFSSECRTIITRGLKR